MLWKTPCFALQSMGHTKHKFPVCMPHMKLHVQLISGAFEHSVLRVWEIYALENSVFYILQSIMGHTNYP